MNSDAPSGAASRSKVWHEGEMDAQCQLPWTLKKPCLLEHLPSMDGGGCFKMTELSERIVSGGIVYRHSAWYPEALLTWCLEPFIGEEAEWFSCLIRIPVRAGDG